jgi:hypothetical protein
MKTTMTFHSIANPRRTVLSRLEEAEQPRTEEAEQPKRTVELPRQVANPRRTTLVDSPE